VTQAKLDKSSAGVFSLQVGAGSKKPKQLSPALRGHFETQGVSLKRSVAEFRVSSDAMLPVGTSLGASHFVAGQHVDVQGFTIGKGFQGPMKRWGFSGLPASHGTTKKHRAHGSIGNSQDPGRVWKGKKMAGRMGNRKRTVQNVFVYKVDPERNLLYVKGQVPGKAGLFLKVRDALRKPPPFVGAADGDWSESRSERFRARGLGFEPGQALLGHRRGGGCAARRSAVSGVGDRGASRRARARRDGDDARPFRLPRRGAARMARSSG
jgi:large subunit ribosomal protein L3